MEKYSFKTSINTSFYLSSPLTENVKKVWIVFHGYGQLAKYFIQKFDVFSSKENVFIAPQALNQFYLNSFTGRVGSTWMTSEDRDEKIEDYLSYLSNLDKLISTIKANNIEVNVLGFSQGGNTLSRYLMSTILQVNKIVFWGSKHADDINHQEFFKKFDSSNFHLVYGENDKLVPASKIEEIKNIFIKYNTIPKVISFKGGHEICKNTFSSIF